MGNEQVDLAIADRNMRTAWRGVLAGSPSPKVQSDGQLEMLSSGLPVALFNPAYVLVPPTDPNGAVTRVVDYYGELGTPFVLSFRESVAPGVAEACEAAGLVEHWQPALMVLESLSPAPESGIDGLQISPVDSSMLVAYGEVLAAGFGMPTELAGLIVGPHLLEVAGFTGLLAVLDGQPVATAGMLFDGDVAGIYNIATVPEARGRGIGAAATWAAVEVGRAQGATWSVLQASQAGEPVYARMGYATPARYRQFEGGSRTSV